MEFIDLKAQYQALKAEIDANVLDVMATARFIGGKYVDEFEQKLAEYTGRKYCITCGDGTDALQLAYMAYGIGAGDAVFCPAMTFIASVEPAFMAGAYPVFCDIDPETYNLSAASLEEKIQATIAEGKYTPKAVVAVDFLGNPADYDAITSICKKYNLLLIEDAAQSTSAEYKGKKCGAFGDISCTSFFPSKPLGCYGDGGAVFTDSDEINELIRSIKVHGKGESKYNNVRVGINSRLDNIQAAVLLPKLACLEKELQKRQEVAKRYNDAFEGKFQIPKITEGSISAYAQYCILAKSKEERDAVLKAMKEANVPSLIYYPKTMHKMPVFDFANGETLPNAEHYADCNFGMPFSAYLTKEDQDYVIKTVLGALH